MEDIKSSYLIQCIFSLLNQKRNFELFKNSKNLQNKLDINIIDYKHLSRKYVIYEENGKKKEYNLDGKLLFEGDYLNGKIIGKGKEYLFYGKLLFEGEYLNDERSGKGKEYDLFGRLEFEGEYLKGKRLNGNGYDKKKILYIF